MKTIQLGNSLIGWCFLVCSVGMGPSLHGQPLVDYTALFDGYSLSGWMDKNGNPAEWHVEDGYLEVVPGKGDIRTESLFDDFDLHFEFWVPYLPDKSGQDRGNSGVFLQGRYEVQILDSYNSDTYPDGVCGALYKQIPPLANASFPPEQWQTYDITFRSPRVDRDGIVKEFGVLTVIQNGIVVIDGGLFIKPTGSAGHMTQGIPGPIRLQDHGSKVRFRNIFIRPHYEQ